MKREQIINKIKEVAAQLTAAEVEVYTNREMYPKCYLAVVANMTNGYKEPRTRLTPNMRPTEVLAYCKGMAAAKNILR